MGGSSWELGIDIERLQGKENNDLEGERERERKRAKQAPRKTKIEQENKEFDEKVLEIPAFLRRQAN